MSTTDEARQGGGITRWSLILMAAQSGDDGAAGRALEELWRIYSQPVTRFISNRGYGTEDARDLTQDFFRLICEKRILKKADASKGRFRALVFACLRNFLSDHADRLRAIRRGGGSHVVSLDDDETAESVESVLAAPVDPSEETFDRDWAARVVQHAMGRLREEFALRGREREYAALAPFLAGEGAGSSYEEAASSLQLPLGTVKSMVHRLRARCGELLREEVAHTLADVADLDDEVRYLCRILGSQPGGAFAGCA
jgi:RNA polymerase sigma factor (sigma-70 family)